MLHYFYIQYWQQLWRCQRFKLHCIEMLIAVDGTHHHNIYVTGNPWSKAFHDSSNWILMSCQPHMVTSGHSNSGHKQIHISKLFLHIYKHSVKSVYKTSHFANIKHTYTNIRHKFLKSVPSILPLLKEHIRLGHAGIINHSI